MKRVAKRKVKIMRREKRHQKTWRATLRKYIFLAKMRTMNTMVNTAIQMKSHRRVVKPDVNKAKYPLKSEWKVAISLICVSKLSYMVFIEVAPSLTTYCIVADWSLMFPPAVSIP